MKAALAGAAGAARAASSPRAIVSADAPQLTPSFFCRVDDDVVYWNSSFLPG